MSKKKTWQQVQEENGFDFEAAYYNRLGGMGWGDLAKAEVGKDLIKRLLPEWCEDNGLDYSALENVDRYQTITDARLVDSGKVMALNKAGWPVKEIAIDCNCTEDCVREILAGKGRK